MHYALCSGQTRARAHTHSHSHTRRTPRLRWMNPRQSRPFAAPHTLCIVTASCVCPHLFSQAVPCNGEEGWGWWEPIQNVVSAGKPSAPPQPVAALRLCPQCAPVPRRAPRGRRDEDRCRQHRHGLRSEHGEWPRYWPGGRAYADAKRTGPRALCVWLAVTSPRPRDPAPSALPTLAHTPCWPWFVFSTHTRATAGVQEETCSALFGKGRVTVAPAERVGRSQRYFRRVSLGVARRRAPSAGNRVACTRGPPHRGPQPPPRQSRSPQRTSQTPPGPATKHPSTNMRFPSVLSLSRPSHTEWQEQQAETTVPAG